MRRQLRARALAPRGRLRSGRGVRGEAACGASLRGSTAGAPSVELDDAGSTEPGGDRFFFLDVPSPGLASVTFDSCGSSFDTMLTLIRMGNESAFGRGDDDFGGGYGYGYGDDDYYYDYDDYYDDDEWFDDDDYGYYDDYNDWGWDDVFDDGGARGDRVWRTVATCDDAGEQRAQRAVRGGEPRGARRATSRRARTCCKSRASARPRAASSSTCAARARAARASRAAPGSCMGALDPCAGDPVHGGNLVGDTTGLPNVLDQTSSGSGGDAVWAFTLAGALDNVVFDSCASSFDTYLSLLRLDYPDDPIEPWTVVVSNDDSTACVGATTRAYIETGHLPAGDYLLVLGGWSTREGRYELAVACSSACGMTCSRRRQLRGRARVPGQRGRFDGAVPSVARGSTVGAPSAYGNDAGDAWYAFSLRPPSATSSSRRATRPSTRTCAAAPMRRARSRRSRAAAAAAASPGRARTCTRGRSPRAATCSSSRATIDAKAGMRSRSRALTPRAAPDAGRRPRTGPRRRAPADARAVRARARCRAARTSETSARSAAATSATSRSPPRDLAGAWPRAWRVRHGRGEVSTRSRCRAPGSRT